MQHDSRNQRLVPRHLVAALASLVSCAPTTPTRSSALAVTNSARETRYVYTIGGRPAGSAELRVADDASWHAHYTYNDRGRGPDVTVTATLDARGLPRTFHAVGHGYERQPVDETLESRDGHLLWHSSVEHGSAANTGGFYIALNDEIVNPAQLARALLAARDHRITLLPAGEAHLEDDLIVPITVAGATRQLELVAIAGIDFAPKLVWLDEHRDLFGSVDSWESVVPAGAEPSVPALLAAQNAWAVARSARLAAQLAHRPPAAGLAFTHAAMFDSIARRLVPDRTVVVVGDQITAVGDATTAIPPGAQVIDARGRTLLPGLWDMHVHLSSASDGLLDLATGITTVRDLGNNIDDLDPRVARFDDGRELGPRVIKAGLIDGPGPFTAPTGAVVANADQAHAAVARYAEHGYVQIKMYSSLDPALVPVIAADAHHRGMRVSGHIPNGMRAADAVVAGYDEIQHVNFLFLQFLVRPGDDTRTPRRFTRVAEDAAGLDLESQPVTAFLDLLVTHRTVLDPTLATFDALFTTNPGEVDPVVAPYHGRLPFQVERAAYSGGLDAPGDKRATFRASYAKLLDFVVRAWRRGIPIVAGTDNLAGLALPRELETYVKAGIPASDVLALATDGAARVMNARDRGAIAPGLLADLVLVDGDPTRDIGAVRRADIVVRRGLVFDPRELFAAAGMRGR